jgi:hypothetical protein
VPERVFDQRPSRWIEAADFVLIQSQRCRSTTQESGTALDDPEHHHPHNVFRPAVALKPAA